MKQIHLLLHLLPPPLLLHVHPQQPLPSPQLHVLLNVLHTCMMLELGNQCTVLVVAVPALLRCLSLPPTPAHAPCLHQPHTPCPFHSHVANPTCKSCSMWCNARTGGAALVRATHEQRH